MRHTFARTARRVSAAAVAALFVAGCSENLTAPGGDASRLTPSGRLRSEAGTAQLIRIGVVSSASSVVVGSAGDYTVHDRATGAALLSGTGGSATVTFQGVVQKYRLQVTCSALATVDPWKTRAQAAGYVTYTEYVPAANCTRLYIGEFAPTASFTVRNSFKTELIRKSLAASDAFWKIVGSGTATYVVTRGADVLQTPNPITLTSSTEVVTINGVPYHGSAEVRVNGAGSLAGINQVPLEQYLYGVVPAELSPVIWPEVEAIKAQAVAARTYALAGLGKRAADGYDLLATTADQVYGGIPYEKEMSNAAVDATRGQVATYDGRLISALYSSTSGGHTADNEESFNSAPVPYLRGVPDEERGAALEHVPSLEVFRSAANAQSLRAVRAGQYEEDWSRWHRWTYEWSPEEMTRVVELFAGQPVGRVLEVNVLERGPSGRALRLEFVTEAGSFYASRDGIRAALKYIPASGTPANLPSTLFFIEPVLDHRTKELDGFRAYGAGLGHGVGMSQTGAVGMAQRGHAYDEILKHYYQGIELAPWY